MLSFLGECSHRVHSLSLRHSDMSIIVKVKDFIRSWGQETRLNMYLEQAHFQEFRVPKSQAVSGESQWRVKQAHQPYGDGAEGVLGV